MDFFGEAFNNAGSGVTTYTSNDSGGFSQVGHISDQELIERGAIQGHDDLSGGGGGKKKKGNVSDMLMANNSI
ncbi:hypothetical protein [Flavobacterium litorale]|uniref:Uncharacterized protein n=1 Tax=Flavobacterium litorale TaxID=2856519 RepID=A0ABX8V6A4_9FLAO|nr:hypothetical protein [Flavobacterium litorale]QYJ68277.1 hypothetical protein K1I41_12245 [Flavobacterium litorale]